MTDRKEEGNWLWESDQTPVEWANWGRWKDERYGQEPNGGNEQNCGVLMHPNPNMVVGKSVAIWGDKACVTSLGAKCIKLICQRVVGKLIII